MNRPALHLYVTRGCPTCRRAERTLRHCERVLRLVELDVVDIEDRAASVPPYIVGGPTTVFEGTVLALGTPDCTQLAERLERLMAARGRVSE